LVLLPQPPPTWGDGPPGPSGGKREGEKKKKPPRGSFKCFPVAPFDWGGDVGQEAWGKQKKKPPPWRGQFPHTTGPHFIKYFKGRTPPPRGGFHGGTPPQLHPFLAPRGGQAWTRGGGGGGVPGLLPFGPDGAFWLWCGPGWGFGCPTVPREKVGPRGKRFRFFPDLFPLVSGPPKHTQGGGEPGNLGHPGEAKFSPPGWGGGPPWDGGGVGGGAKFSGPTPVSGAGGGGKKKKRKATKSEKSSYPPPGALKSGRAPGSNGKMTFFSPGKVFQWGGLPHRRFVNPLGKIRV